MRDFPKTNELFDLDKTVLKDRLEKFRHPWNALSSINDWIEEIGPTLSPELYDNPEENVWIAKSAIVSPSASINAPCIIGERTEVRHCAYIRGGVIIGNDCVVGNSTEIKGSILFNEAKAPHFNYVGDSILGYKAHLGAGVITSNVRLDNKTVKIRTGNLQTATGRRKLGAMVGDNAEIGCGTVLNPGTVIGRMSAVYPLVSVRGVVPEDSVVKTTFSGSEAKEEE